MPDCLDMLSAPEPVVLILGSMPGDASLKQRMYYAHPQNRFWRIIFEYFGVPFSKEISDRAGIIKNNKLALFESIKSCERTGSSLDSKIKNAVPNDIGKVLEEYPSIKAILLNGKKSAEIFFKYNNPSNVHTFVMPSTSPANAAAGYPELFSAWKAVLDKFLKD